MSSMNQRTFSVSIHNNQVLIMSGCSSSVEVCKRLIEHRKGVEHERTNWERRIREQTTNYNPTLSPIHQALPLMRSDGNSHSPIFHSANFGLSNT